MLRSNDNPKASDLDGELDRKCYLVLGAGGFLGKTIVRQLRRRGADVRCFGRAGQNPFIDRRTTWFDAEFSDREMLARALQGVDVVFHLLGVSVPSVADADAERDLHEGVVRNLQFLQACAAAKVSRLVFCSSGGAVYGRKLHMPIAETALTEPVSAYGVNKLAIEHYLRVEQARSGLDYRVLRVANAYGPGQHGGRGQGLVAALMERILCKIPLEIWGDGSVIRDYVYVDDVADAFIRASHYTGSQVTFNIGSGTGRSVKSVIAHVANALHMCPGRILYTPTRPVDVPVNILDSSLVKRELNWRPQISWETGLTHTATWMREELDRPLEDIHEPGVAGDLAPSFYPALSSI